MSIERFQRADALFRDVVDLDSAERAAKLSEACADDTALRRQVEAMLDADATEDPLLDTDLDVTGSISTAASPERVGPYRIVDVLGQGGMGVVYRARQRDPDRDVAVKVLRAGPSTAPMIRRFRQEARVLAHLAHPGIAQVYEAGVCEEIGGAPFFAMELIDGRPLNEHAVAHALSIERRVMLLMRLCEAVQHAHQRGVIHRDLKPGNILVVDDGGVGQPKVLDFGVARADGPELRTTTLQTAAGQLVGTLAYMSPEQVSGDPDSIDTRTDVYAIGVLGYELLAGALPIEIDPRSVADAVRRIETASPKRLGDHDRRLRGDLETIFGKALAKDKTMRYASASELAADLRRHLDDEPIAARPASALYHVRKFAQRNPALATSLVVTALTLAVAVVIVSVLFARAEARAERLRRSGYAQSISLAQNAYESADTAQLNAHLASCPADLRGWEWQRLRYVADDSVLALRGHRGLVRGVAFSRDGTRIASCAGYGYETPADQRDRSIRVWDAATGEEVFVLDDHRGAVNEVIFSTCGRWIISAGGTHWQIQDERDVDVRVWDAETGQLVRTIPIDHGSSVWAMCELSGGRVAVGGDGTMLTIARLDDGSIERVVDVNGIHGLVATDTSIYAASWSGAIRVIDLETFEVVADRSFGAPPFQDLAIDPTGTRLAAGNTDHTVMVLDAATLDVIWERRDHADQVEAVAFMPDGRTVVSGGGQTVRLFDAADGRPVGTRRGSEGRVYCLAVSPDGMRIAASGVGAVVRVWSARDVDHAVLQRTKGEVNAAFWIDGDSAIATASDDQFVRVLDAVTGEERERYELPTPVYSLDVSPDGATFVAGCQWGQVVLIDRETGAMRLAETEGSHTVSVRFDRDGSSILSAGALGVLTRWTTSTLAIERVYGDDLGVLKNAELSNDGDRIVAITRDGDVLVYDVASGERLQRLRTRALEAEELTFSPDDALLAVSNVAGTVYIFETSDWTLVEELQPFDIPSLGLSFSSDGERLLTTAHDGRVSILATDTWLPLMTFRAHTQKIYAVVFDDAAERLLTCGGDGTVRVWPTRRGR